MKKSILEVPQESDTYLQTQNGKGFSVRYASVRSMDSRDHSQPGQDYLSMHLEPKAITFVLCDGVSQSFHGDIASKYLGERLLDWAIVFASKEQGMEKIETELSGFLASITSYASEVVGGFRIPEETPDLFKEVLEDKRALGSETTFVFGRIEMPGRKFPRGWALLSYMGDTRLRVGDGKGWGAMLTDMEVEGKKRWSSRKGLVGGSPFLCSFELVKDKKRGVNRIISYTDGLALLDDIQDKPRNEALNDIIGQAVNSVTNDDASFLEIEIE